MTTASEIPELLAPAGDWDCARAAVENGADAIYFGLDCGMNARARAQNFDLDDLPNLMRFLHRRGVKGYVTINTLAFPSELPEVENILRGIAAAAADAILVQDFGVARLAHEICPELEIHASTQMTLTSAECIEVTKQLGIKRVVLARELSIEEISQIHRQTEMPLEAFVHGALCVAYSGQCLTSESLGGRSANRGQCAQACRLPYELTCDGEDVELGDVQYLLSPQDLAAYELTPELIAAGVCSFKIEGRLKTPEYVANITKHYRRAIDAAREQKPISFSRQEVEEMELSFSRGFSPGWLPGSDHKMLVPGQSSSKRGVLLGKIIEVRTRGVAVALCATISRGDGIVFTGDRAKNEEQGGRVYQVFRNQQLQNEPIGRGTVELRFNRNDIELSRLYPGQSIWKTDDPQLTIRLRRSFTGSDPIRRVPLDLKVTAIAGQPLQITGTTTTGATCQLQSVDALQPATRHPASLTNLREQLQRLGQTVYQLRNVKARIHGGPMVPHSVLGTLRREMIRQLDNCSLDPPRKMASTPVLPRLRSQNLSSPELPTTPEIHLLCRSLNQVQAALQQNVKQIYVDFQDIREYHDAVQSARGSDAQIFLATPRIQKPNEIGVFRKLLQYQPHGILARNLSGLSFFRSEQLPVIADFSFNIANELTAAFLVDQGAERLTASYDLNRDQLLDLVSSVPAPWLELVIHQHMPMFHMEHCVFCAVLSPGTNKTNCGRPCDVHQVKLRDRIGMEHPLTADVGCRNTLFNATPQSAAELVPQLVSAGIRHFRIEFLPGETTQLPQVLSLYRDLLADRVSGQEVWTALQASNRVGVTRGTLEESRNPLAIL
ncbi:MAG: DUF3656 domain-containing protein [Pirellulaceae bacterium]|nr:DUF3656 domain-containing protein [Pirellulaceae bacterium]